MGKVDELLTVGSTLSTASIQCQSDFPPSCQEDEVNITLERIPTVFMTFQLLFEFCGLGSANIWFAKNLMHLLYFLYCLVRTLLCWHLTGSLDNYSVLAWVTKASVVA